MLRCTARPTPFAASGSIARTALALSRAAAIVAAFSAALPLSGQAGSPSGQKKPSSRPGEPSQASSSASASAIRGKTSAGDNGSLIGPNGALAPNELGRIPIVEWHQVVDADGTYKVSRERFLAELTELHSRGYVPISLGDYLDRKIDIPAGKSPVLFTFDDASPSQFSYIERNGKLEIDPRSAMGILNDFLKKHPDWKPKGVFCLLPAAQVGHAFFGDKGIDGQKSEWRLPKVRYLAEQGYDLCNHTLWHAQLNKYSEAVVQEQLARGAMAIDSAVPGYTVRALALPYGIWPKNRALAYSGSWFDKKSKRDIKYNNEAVFEVAGGPARSPFDPAFDARKLPRVPLQGGTKLKPTLDAMDKPGPMARYVSDGNPAVIAKPAK